MDEELPQAELPHDVAIGLAVEPDAAGHPDALAIVQLGVVPDEIEDRPLVGVLGRAGQVAVVLAIDSDLVVVGPADGYAVEGELLDVAQDFVVDGIVARPPRR